MGTLGNLKVSRIRKDYGLKKVGGVVVYEIVFFLLVRRRTLSLVYDEVGNISLVIVIVWVDLIVVVIVLLVVRGVKDSLDLLV